MDIQKVVENLQNNGVLHTAPVKIESLTGGTVSKLYLLYLKDNDKLVVKFNNPIIIEAESFFLKFYEKISLLPSLIEIEGDFQYIVYEYLTGQVNSSNINKEEVLISIVNSLINHYRPLNTSSGWGWMDDPSNSWSEFLLREMQEAEKIINQKIDLEDKKLVYNLIRNLESREEGPFLIHGDCGIHNFLMKDNRLNGVIDPTPVLGYPLYDLVYAFCSSPDDLTKETIYSAVSHLIQKPKSKQIVNEAVLIGLFLRMASCMKHHPNDLPLYIKAWEYWKRLV